MSVFRLTGLTVFAAWIVMALIVGLVASDVVARNVTLVLKDGRRISGQMVAETGDEVTVKVAGIETTFSRDQIAELEVEMTLAEQYQKARSEIKDDDYNARYELARRMYDTKTTAGYKLALTELDSILADQPDHQMAKLLKNVVTERIKMAPKDETPDTPTRPVPPPTVPPVQPPDGNGGDEPAADGGPRELTDEEINIINVYEIRLDTKPNVFVPNDVIDEVLDKYQNDEVMEPYLGRNGNARFRRLAGWQQLGILFDLKAREYYGKVRINPPPPENIQKFMQDIHRQYVIGYCGQCHGEGKAPGLYVKTRPATRPQTAYQNFMILRRTSAGPLPLIFTGDPGRSPLIQFGLPAKDARTPHPQVNDKPIRHYFNGPDDPRLTFMREWIGKLYGEAQDYPINFQPPKPTDPDRVPEKPADPQPAGGGNTPPPAR